MEIRKVFDTLERPARDVTERDEHYTIIETYEDIDYTLIYRHTKFQPWVAAWGYRPERESWQQGHYFEKADEAIQHIINVYKEKKSA